MAPHGARRIFPANPDLADILGDVDSDFENFYFLHFLDSKFLDFQVLRSSNSQISRFPDLQIRFSDTDCSPKRACTDGVPTVLL